MQIIYGHICLFFFTHSSSFRVWFCSCSDYFHNYVALYSYYKELQLMKERQKVLHEENEALKREIEALKQDNDLLRRKLQR